jgi:hypothetical protein
MYSNIFVLLLFTLFHFLNIFYIYNTLFTATVSNNPLTIGVIFSVLLGHDEHLQVFGRSGSSVDGDKLRSCVHYCKAVTYVGQQINHPTETIFSQIRCGKTNKIPLHLQCQGRSSRKGKINSFINVRYLFRPRSCSGPPKIYCVPLIFRHSAVARHKLDVAT